MNTRISFYVIFLLSCSLLAFMPNCQSKPEKTGDWIFEHCTPTNKDCGRRE